MNSSQVIKILRFFGDIEKEIKLYRRMIDDIDESYYNAVGAVNYDEPVVSSGGVGNPTLKRVMNLPESIAPYRRQLEKYIAEISKLKTEIFSEIEKLGYLEKSVIWKYYTENLNLEKISQKEHCSLITCKRYKKRGIKKLELYFETNKFIRNFSQKDKIKAPAWDTSPP